MTTRLAATVLALLAGAAHAERPPVAVVWLDGPNAAVAAIDRGLAASKEVRPLDDGELKRLLAEGGAAPRADALLATARNAFFAGSCAEAVPSLDAVEQLAESDLSVEQGRKLVAQAASLRLRCADLARDDAAAERAAAIFVATRVELTPEIGQVLARHPQPSPTMQPEVRVESEPPGAMVYVDFAAVGPTPIALPALRRPDALVDVELAGYRRVRRVAPAPGTLAVALARDDRPAPLIDRVRGAAGNAPEADVTALGRRIGAARVLVARLDGSRGEVQARVLDVATARWSRPVLIVPIATAPERLAHYAALGKGDEAPAAIAVAKPPPPEVPPWKRWYTWVGAGALVAIIVAVVIANHVGSDQLTISVGH